MPIPDGSLHRLATGVSTTAGQRAEIVGRALNQGALATPTEFDGNTHGATVVEQDFSLEGHETGRRLVYDVEVRALGRSLGTSTPDQGCGGFSPTP